MPTSSSEFCAVPVKILLYIPPASFERQILTPATYLPDASALAAPMQRMMDRPRCIVVMPLRICVLTIWS